jgi:hypothetical protein
MKVQIKGRRHHTNELGQFRFHFEWRFDELNVIEFSLQSFAAVSVVDFENVRNSNQ